MKKKVIVIAIVLIVLFGVYFIGSGFVKNTACYIEDFTVSPNGKEIMIDIGVSSSIGYIRNVSIDQQEGGKLYLCCYSAFGGINGKVGAKNTFTIPLAEDTSTIALYVGTDCYKVVLQKSQDGIWQRAAE